MVAVMAIKLAVSTIASEKAKYKQALDDPPALKNGRVTPITGSRFRHMPRLVMV